MKIKYILFISVIMISIVGADIFGISLWNKDISLNETQTDRIKDAANIQEISLKIDKLRCDENECWTKIYQKNLINTKWRRDKSYCYEFDDKEILNDNENIKCLIWSDYTLEENEQAIQDYAEKRINDWAIVEEVRQDKIIEIKKDVGTISEVEVIGNE